MTAVQVMSEVLKTSVVFVPLGEKGRIWFGVVFVPRTGVWLVWSAPLGGEPVGLSSWKDRDQAELTLDWYLAAVGGGFAALREAVDRSRKASVANPIDISAEERNVLSQQIARAASAERGWGIGT
jgi:hypothetical protein